MCGPRLAIARALFSVKINKKEKHSIHHGIILRIFVMRVS